MILNKVLLYSIYEDIKKDNYIREKELSKKYFYSVRTIRRYIGILKKKGLIDTEIKGPYHKWMIK